MLSRISKTIDALPITATEFFEKTAIWQKKDMQTASARPIKIGLCVSGGADSMCLAHLFQQVQDEGLSLPLDIRAYVVDHKARHESTDEAHAVLDALKGIGLKPHVLTMSWPEGIQVSKLPNFETQARNQRYRLLAQASMRAGISDLFLGHHQDDQLETIMMRLVRGHRGSLACFEGMSPQIPISGCEDLHNGQSDANAVSLTKILFGEADKRVAQNLPQNQQEVPLRNTIQNRISIASSPNVRLHRPLLDFPKTRILSTCAANGVPFVSDLTNFDPTVTLRNAVRHMISCYKLPRALSKQSLLETRAKALNRRLSREHESSKIFDASQLTAMDMRSGSLTVCLPRYLQVFGLSDPQTPARFLGRLLEMVAPGGGKGFFVTAPQAVATAIFPEDEHHSELDSSLTSASALTANKVLLTRTKPSKFPNRDIYTTWRLSRQPFHRTELVDATKLFEYQSSSDIRRETTSVSNWLLWDNRYWLKIQCASEGYLRTCIVRPFQLSDAASLRELLGSKSKYLLRRFDTLLKEAAPGDERYTLPVFVDDRGIRAFPTLAFSIPVNNRDQSGLISWQVMYKHIESATIDYARRQSPSRLQYERAALAYAAKASKRPTFEGLVHDHGLLDDRPQSTKLQHGQGGTNRLAPFETSNL